MRTGQAVRDLDGTELGRVTALHEGSFTVSKGLFLFRRDAVARYDEVRGVRDGVLVLARSARDLDELAAGRIPPSWRIPTPPGFPASATPSEARFVFEDLAARAFAPRAIAAPVPQTSTGRAPPAPEDERAHARSAGEAEPQVPPP